MSFFQRFSADATNAASDLYSNWVLGDDAGKSARLTLILHPKTLPIRSSRPGTARIDLGMTFLEVNGRAYVSSIAPGSPAAAAGVQPQDAVQYATVFRPEWNDDNTVIEMATRFVLEAEDRGLRITYDELRNLLAEALDPTQAAFLSPPTSASKNSHAAWSGPPIPSTVNICVPVEEGFVGMDPFSGEAPRPVVFCFRRTRQRKALHHLGLPTFRLDDECDFATSLVKRLAPTADMEIPPPDTWEELVHDGTDWLLGTGSILPPKHAAITANNNGNGENNTIGSDDDPGSIPLDDLERARSNKLAQLRSRMAAESMQVDRTDDVEASTIRGMIQKAVGLAFVRASKVVLGVSLHAGSGVVIARLSDGTWSAPSAIGTWGLGLGLQFGLEVAEYIFILQTNEAVEHFKRGGSYTVGGNVGAAVAGLGREAYGAASVGGVCGGPNQVKDDEYNDSDSRDNAGRNRNIAIAPIVAYAKSQGLYVGVSLEGSRMFVRNDINGRTYKFGAGRNITALDVLSGRVPTPPEAEELYAALHSVEFTHEMSCLPRPPEIFRSDSASPWYYDRSTLGAEAYGKIKPFKFLSMLTPEESEACDLFETQFKKFLYGGVSVQRLLPDTDARSGRTRRERRTLWLMLPEVGSLRLGFVSKLSDGDGPVSNKSSTQRARLDDRSRMSGIDADVGTVGSEEVTLDSALNTRDGGSVIGHIRNGNVQLSNKHSVALTDVTVLSQEPMIPIRFKGDDKMEHLRVISIQDVSGTSLLFLANNFREAELLVCGLKLMLERETVRLGVRGGLPISAFGERNHEGAISPSAARGYRDISESHDMPSIARKRGARSSRSVSSVASSEVGNDEASEMSDVVQRALPQDRRAWGNVPGRQYMRGQAAAVSETMGSGYLEKGVPRYVHGQQIVKEIAKDIQLPLPLPLCRVLLLDSTSPVIRKWEKDRGDFNFEKTHWMFPPATPRELERHASEHQLIASGSMAGASRTTQFNRPRYGSLVRLSETHIVDSDDSKKLAFTVTERTPRRGFSIQVRILLQDWKENFCEASVVALIRPIGKDMSNQAAVHKAFMLVLDEIMGRYGVEGTGLLAGFLSVVDNMAEETKEHKSVSGIVPRPFSRTVPNNQQEEKKSDYAPANNNNAAANNNRFKKDKQNTGSGLVSFSDMIPVGRSSPDVASNDRPSTPSLLHQVPEPDPSRRLPHTDLSTNGNGGNINNNKNGSKDALSTSSNGATGDKGSAVIEVKPLPKIRLSLMPSPREEDEENSSTSSPVPSKPVRKKKPRKRLVK